MSLTEWKNEFEGKRIAIWGYGMEGQSTYRLIRRLLPDQVLTIADGGKNLEKAKQETVNTQCVNDQDVNFSDYDLIMKAPGIVVPPGMDKTNISGETQLFLKHYADRCIGITGTKGKSTTTSLVYALLKDHMPTVLVGNIGKPCFEAVDEMERGAAAAFEISCHQLEFCPYSPHIGVYLNLYEEHLDHYGSFEAYGNAKFNILKHQKTGDIAIIHSDLKQYISQLKEAPLLIGKDIYAEGNCLHIPQHSINIQKCRLIGDHNYQNLAVAYYIAKLYDVNDDEIQKACAQFVPLHHRLEDLGVHNGFRYVNDSISTIGQAAIAALEALDDVGTILIGGNDRGIEYDELENYLHGHTGFNVIFMYATGHRIYQEMDKKHILRDGFYQCKDLYEAMNLARKITPEGKIILLSPAASSYDHFKNFEERGKVFARLAEENNV